MRKLLLTTAAAATIFCTAARADSCVRQNDISNYTAISDRLVVVENYHHQKVLLKLIGTCSNLRYHESLAIQTRGESGLSCVQAGDMITTHNSGASGTCAIVSVTPYNGSMNWRGGHPSDRSHD